MSDQTPPDVGPPSLPALPPTAVSSGLTGLTRLTRWTGSHVLLFFLSACATSLLFSGHPRVGRAWGILLHFLLPAAVGGLQALWLRGSVRNVWLWIPASVLGLPQCLIFGEGWGVLPVLGFGMAVLQAAVVRPWGFRFTLLWITLSGWGWMLAWNAAPALDTFSPGWLINPISGGAPPPLEMALAGIVYGLFTSPILFHPNARLPKDRTATFRRFPWWIPSGMVVAMLLVTFYFAVHFGRLIQARNSLVTLIVGSPDPTVTRWADLPIVLVPLLSGEFTYRCITWNCWAGRILSPGAISFLAAVRGVDGRGRRHR